MLQYRSYKFNKKNMSNKTYVSIIVIVLVVAALVFILKIKKSEAPEINTIGDETSMPLSGENTETSASLETTNSDNLIAEVKEFTITCPSRNWNA